MRGREGERNEKEKEKARQRERERPAGQGWGAWDWHCPLKDSKEKTRETVKKDDHFISCGRRSRKTCFRVLSKHIEESKCGHII